MKKSFSSVSEYIQLFSPEIQKILEKIRAIVKDTAPNAIESISYQMPAYKLNGKPLVYFAAWQTHIGFYALPSGNKAFQQELANYKVAKGSIRFRLDQPIPYELIKKIVQFRASENLSLKW